MAKNLFNLEFDVNSEEAQRSFEKMIATQKQYAEALRQTVRETLNLKQGERITEQQINQVQRLIRLERERQQYARRDAEQQIMNNRRLTTEERNRALNNIRQQEQISQIRAADTDNRFAAGRSTLLRQESERAQSGQQQPQQRGNFASNVVGTSLRSAGGATPGFAGSVLGILGSGGGLASIATGIIGAGIGAAIGVGFSAYNKAMNRDVALQAVMANTQGRYAREAGAITGSNFTYNPALLEEMDRLDIESKYGSTRTIDKDGRLVQYDKDSYNASRKLFDEIDVKKAKSPSIWNRLGGLALGTLGGLGGSDAILSSMGLAKSDARSAYLEGVNNESASFWKREVGIGSAMEKMVADARDYLDGEGKAKLNAELAKGRKRDDVIRDLAYENYRKEFKEQQEAGLLKKSWNYATRQQIADITAIKGKEDGTTEANDTHAAGLKAQEKERIAKEEAIQRQKEFELNRRKVENGNYNVTDNDMWQRLGMSKTEALKFVAQAVQAMPNLSNITQEGYHLALYSRAGMDASRIAGLNPYFDSGQNLTGGRIFSMLYRLTGGGDLSGANKYMQGFQQLLPQMMSSFASFNGNEISNMIGSMKKIQDSFSKLGSTVFSGAMLGQTIGSVNASFKDRSNDWKETLLYQAGAKTWEYYVNNPNAEGSPFNRNSDSYNLALDEYRRRTGGQFSFQANNMMREMGLFNNDRTIEGTMKMLHDQFGNNYDSLLAAVKEIFTKAASSPNQTAELIANNIMKGNYDMFSSGEVSKDYLEINPYVTDPLKARAAFEDAMEKIGEKVIQGLSSLIRATTRIANKVEGTL